MPQVIIPNPILNSPFDEPTRHFFFDEDGITRRRKTQGRRAQGSRKTETGSSRLDHRPGVHQAQDRPARRLRSFRHALLPERLRLPRRDAISEKWWALRRERQQQIDASIARRAETEYLYDQPYEDSKRIRVSGPFTVESLSPHRVLSTDEERPRTEATGEREDNAGQFVNVILDNLRKAGVQNTVKNERLKFDRLDAYAGVNVHATGEFAVPGGKSLRVAVCIGPQYGTV